MIHPTAIVSPKAEIDPTCRIGAYSIIGDGVILGANCEVDHHVSIQGPCRIGSYNRFHPFSSIGGRSQDMKYQGEPTWLEIADRNEFREYVTLNRATGRDEKTVIGSDNLLLAYSHVAHNCVVGNHCIFSNCGTLAGHVEVGDYVVIGGLSAVHQFCRIGRHALIGGCTKIVQDVPPYLIADGNPAALRSVNTVGLQRRGFSEDRLSSLRKALRMLMSDQWNTSQACDHIESELASKGEVTELVEFIRTSKRGIIR